MTSVVSICNIALSNVGKTNINALNEASAEARICAQFYEQTRDALLQVYPWSFAGKAAALAEIINDRPASWGHAYTRPVDCLKVRWLAPNLGAASVVGRQIDKAEELKIPYEIDGGTIYTNQATAFLRYTYRVTDPTRFSPLFVDALSWHLAVRIAMPLTKDPKVRADAYQLAIRSQGSAAETDASETSESYSPSGDIAEARN